MTDRRQDARVHRLHRPSRTRGGPSALREVRPDDPASRSDVRASHPSALATLSEAAEHDPLGKMALFSGERPSALLGALIVDCSACRRETPVSLAALIRAAFPFSLHLPVVKRYHSLMRCPACGRRTWVRILWRP